MKKWFVIGVLAGFLFGFIAEILFPKLLSLDIVFNALFRQQSGLPLNPTYSSGSVLAAGALIPFVFAAVGGGFGALIYWLKQKLFR